MVKLDQFLDKRKKELVSKLIKEEINTQWVRELLFGKKGIRHSGGQSNNSLVDNFEIYVWDNLTEEKQRKIVEALNLIIEEDLFLTPLPDDDYWLRNYWYHLLDFAVLLEKKFPGKINAKPILTWKEKDYPNLSQPVNHNYPHIRDIDQKIETVFGKK